MKTDNAQIGHYATKAREALAAAREAHAAGDASRVGWSGTRGYCYAYAIRGICERRGLRPPGDLPELLRKLDRAISRLDPDGDDHATD